ncbi:MAG: TIGR00730 family Rossman fold protein [Candidatus Acidiferrum sp.]
MKSICVFCGSHSGNNAIYEESARATGRALVRAGLRLVYGGGKVGLMGILADTVLAGGGEVIGVITRGLFDREIGHQGIRDLRVVESMHERKELMASLADGFIALPGGVGTLEEIFEQWAWSQLGIHAKPCGFLNVNGYFTPLIAMIDHMVAEGFLSPAFAAMIAVETEPDGLLARFRTYQPPAKRWSTPGSPVKSE